MCSVSAARSEPSVCVSDRISGFVDHLLAFITICHNAETVAVLNRKTHMAPVAAISTAMLKSKHPSTGQVPTEAEIINLTSQHLVRHASRQKRIRLPVV